MVQARFMSQSSLFSCSGCDGSGGVCVGKTISILTTNGRRSSNSSSPLTGREEMRNLKRRHGQSDERGALGSPHCS